LEWVDRTPELGGQTEARKAPTGPARSGRRDDKLSAVPTRSFTEADQQIAAAIGERKCVEKRRVFDLEPLAPLLRRVRPVAQLFAQ
jgi:hypothetical protein